jgi:DNA-binding IclR family transcriptional regulator
MRKAKGEYSIQTVVNAMRLLEAFRDAEELGVTELSHRLGLHKNNVFRLLATLEQQGYIEQSPDTERYRLGVASMELGQAFGRSRTLLRRVRRVLEDLALRSQESAHVGLMRDFEVVHVAGEQVERLVATSLRVGRRLPVHCTALGKVLLGCSPEDVRQAYDRSIASRGGLVQRTPRTIVDGHKFFEELRTVAVRGFALDVGECEEGLCCAAAPVFDADGQVVAALSVSGPGFRLGEERLLDEVTPMVVEAAERLSRDLGFAG